jgi:hypothetical protein
MWPFQKRHNPKTTGIVAAWRFQIPLRPRWRRLIITAAAEIVSAIAAHNARLVVETDWIQVMSNRPLANADADRGRV